MLLVFDYMCEGFACILNLCHPDEGTFDLKCMLFSIMMYCSEVIVLYNHKELRPEVKVIITDCYIWQVLLLDLLAAVAAIFYG